MEPLSLSLLTTIFNIVKNPLKEAVWPADRPILEREVEDNFGDRFGAGMCAWVSSVRSERLKYEEGYFYVQAEPDGARVFRRPNKGHDPQGREFLMWQPEWVKRLEHGG